MSRYGVLSGLILIFTIDRIEADWAVVEWRGSTCTSEIEVSLFETQPHEGEQWAVELRDKSSGTAFFDREQHAFTTQRGRLFLSHHHPPPTFLKTEIRMHRISKNNPTGGDQT